MSHIDHATWSVHCGPWVVASTSSTGAQHLLCEDAALAHFPLSGGLHVCVADGVSRGDVGHVAAQRLARHCVGLPETIANDAAAIARWVEAADEVVATAVTSCGHRRGAACMASAWLDASGEGYLSHVGDCRIYRWTLTDDAKIQVTALTRDQSYLELGEDPPWGVNINNPARMVGSGSVGIPSVQNYSLERCSGLLLCSDGVHDVLDEHELSVLVERALPNKRTLSAIELQKITDAIVREALKQGSSDDICVALIWHGDSNA